MISGDGSLGIFAAVWSGLSARDKTIVQYLYESVALGVPVAYDDSADASLQVFDWEDYEAEHIAILATVIDNIASIAPGYTVPMDGGDIDREQLASDMLTFAGANGLVEPTTEETWRAVIDAQGTANTKMTMNANELPDTAVSRIFCIGDSKTDGDAWPDALRDLLTVSTSTTWGQGNIQFAYSGASVNTMLDYVDANLADLAQTPTHVLINLGSNDVKNGLPVEATWKSEMTEIIDSCLAKWSSIDVYIAKAWRRGQDANCVTMAGWVDTIVASYGANVFVGHDENIWLENGDDGVTYTIDGVHYNTPGNTECAAQWEAILNP